MISDLIFGSPIRIPKSEIPMVTSSESVKTDRLPTPQSRWSRPNPSTTTGKNPTTAPASWSCVGGPGASSFELRLGGPGIAGQDRPAAARQRWGRRGSGLQNVSDGAPRGRADWSAIEPPSGPRKPLAALLTGLPSPFVCAILYTTIRQTTIPNRSRKWLKSCRWRSILGPLRYETSWVGSW